MANFPTFGGNGGAGALVVDSAHMFAGATKTEVTKTRDDYFVAHPSELVECVKVTLTVGTEEPVLEEFRGGEWVDITPVLPIKGPKGDTGSKGDKGDIGTIEQGDQDKLDKMSLPNESDMDINVQNLNVHGIVRAKDFDASLSSFNLGDVISLSSIGEGLTILEKNGDVRRIQTPVVHNITSEYAKAEHKKPVVRDFVISADDSTDLTSPIEYVIESWPDDNLYMFDHTLNFLESTDEMRVQFYRNDDLIWESPAMHADAGVFTVNLLPSPPIKGVYPVRLFKGATYKTVITGAKLKGSASGAPWEKMSYIPFTMFEVKPQAELDGKIAYSDTDVRGYLGDKLAYNTEHFIAHDTTGESGKLRTVSAKPPVASATFDKATKELSINQVTGGEPVKVVIDIDGGTGGGGDIKFTHVAQTDRVSASATAEVIQMPIELVEADADAYVMSVPMLGLARKVATKAEIVAGTRQGVIVFFEWSTRRIMYSSQSMGASDGHMSIFKIEGSGGSGSAPPKFIATSITTEITATLPAGTKIKVTGDFDFDDVRAKNPTITYEYYAHEVSTELKKDGDGAYFNLTEALSIPETSKFLCFCQWNDTSYLSYDQRAATAPAETTVVVDIANDDLPFSLPHTFAK